MQKFFLCLCCKKSIFFLGLFWVPPCFACIFDENPESGYLYLKISHQQSSIMRGLGYVDLAFVHEDKSEVARHRMNVHTRLLPKLGQKKMLMQSVNPLYEIIIPLNRDILNQPVWLEVSFLTELARFYSVVDKYTTKRIFHVRHDYWLGKLPQKLVRFDQLKLKDRSQNQICHDINVNLHLSIMWDATGEYPEIKWLL